MIYLECANKVSIVEKWFDNNHFQIGAKFIEKCKWIVKIESIVEVRKKNYFLNL